jgi:hypothetical protein
MPRPRDSTLPLWFGLLGPPAFWAARISVSYVLIPFVCRAGDTLALHLVALFALVGTTAAGVTAYRAWRAARRSGSSGSTDVRRARSSFLGLSGMLIAGLFWAVIVAESIANWLFDPCLAAGAVL